MLLLGALASKAASRPGQASIPAPTWAAQIAPILYANCTTCHHPGGGGPFSLMTYPDAQRWGTQIAAVTGSHYMPPWLPEHQGGAFADERRLTPEQIQQIRRWAEASMPQGDAAPPTPPVYTPGWQRGTPDLILTVQEPYPLAASGTDVFRNFVLPYPLAETHSIRAIEIRPGTPEIVHHANILIDPTASFRRAHPQDWKQGVPGMEIEVDAGNTFDPDGHFLFWKPDSPVLEEPEGLEWQISPGTDLILNMHLKPSGRAEQITAQIGLYFTDRRPSRQPMLLQLEHDAALQIPAGASDFRVEDSLRLPIAVDLLGIYPHAHYLGHRMEAWAALPGGAREPLITVPEWDIDRQSVYRYRKPIRLPAGTVLNMRYSYDNSAANIHNPHQPPIAVHAGNRSEDEMAHLWLQVLPIAAPKTGAEDPRLALEQAWMRSRLVKEPGDTIAEYDLAAALAGQGKLGEAAETYRALLQQDPRNQRARNALGVVLEEQGDWQQARASYAQAIAAEPGGACDARFNLGRLLVKHELYQDAEREFREALGGCPQDAALHSGLGASLAGEGRVEQAENEFEQALRIDPNDTDALTALGLSALDAGQPDRALPLLERAARARPGDPEAHRTLATAYGQLGRMGDAITELRSAVVLAPDTAQLHATLSQALMATGALEEAVVEQKKALALAPRDADQWNDLGVMEARQGKPAEARADFKRALALSPGHAQASANLARLTPHAAGATIGP